MLRPLASAVLASCVVLGASSTARAALPCTRGALAREAPPPQALPADEPMLVTLRGTERAAERVVRETNEERARAYERAFHASLPAWRRLTGIIDTASERRAHEAASRAINLQYAARVGAAHRDLVERKRAREEAERKSAERMAAQTLPRGAETEWLSLAEADRERRLARFTNAELAAMSLRLTALQLAEADRPKRAAAVFRLENACVPPQLWEQRDDAFVRSVMPLLTSADLEVMWAEFARAENERADQRALERDWEVLRASNPRLKKEIDDKLAAERERTLTVLGPESKKQLLEDFELIVVLERRQGGLAWSARLSPKPSLERLQLRQALAGSVEWVVRSLEVGQYERVATPELARTPDEALHRYATHGRRPPAELVKHRRAGGALQRTGDEALLIPWGWLRHGMNRAAEPQS